MIFAPERPDLGYDSLFKINGERLPQGSATGMDCDLEEEILGEWDRSLRGGLIFYGIQEFGIRVSPVISCSGVPFAPPIMSWDPYAIHSVEWPIEWAMNGLVEEADLLRPAVAGTIRYKGLGRNALKTIGTPDNPPADPSLVIQTEWRPRLLLVITGRSIRANEWSKRTKDWSVSFREHEPDE